MKMTLIDFYKDLLKFIEDLQTNIYFFIYPKLLKITKK